MSVIGGAGLRRLAVFCPPARKGRQVQGRRSPRVKLGPHDGFRAAFGNDLAQTGLMRGCGPGMPRPHRSWTRAPSDPAAVLVRPTGKCVASWQPSDIAGRLIEGCVRRGRVWHLNSVGKLAAPAMLNGLLHRPTCSELIHARVAIAPHTTWQNLNSQPRSERIGIGTVGCRLQKVTPDKQRMPNGVKGR